MNRRGQHDADKNGPDPGDLTGRPVAAAVANAIYDATGVRLRRAPFRAERVLAALEAAGV